MGRHVGPFEVEFWWELSTLIVIMLLGHWLEMRLDRPGAGRSRALAELLPDDGRAGHTDGGIETVALASWSSATSFWSGPVAGCPPTAGSSRATPTSTNR